ncbi:serine-tRNA(Ala) deacylase AlaX [Bacillus carboniphilus]|uniref:Serine-tRNA(Ala) deacylase AlaX n=1 Tax=Bacillus carboniphilus TaxID=86663 RepID=A0ABN0VR85_9BACI
MEHKIYYENPYLKAFEANVLKQEQDDTGREYVVLDQTAFYPTGGGQPHDTGTLNGIQVIDVEEIEGEIRHFLEAPISKETVVGEIDWQRRFDHMQQHAGQHILSAAFEELFDIHTVSFHLGSETLTIDLDTHELTEDVALQAETLANQIILENRPIETKWVTKEGAKSYPLRKELSVDDNIRLVIIPNFDYNGCGGTHPDSTGQVMGIKIVGWEVQRKKIRLRFVCGNRILKQLAIKQKITSELGQLLNAPEEDLTQATIRLLDKNKDIEKRLEETKELLIQFEANQLINQSQSFQQYSLIAKAYENRTLKELQTLARTIVSEKDQCIVHLVSKNDHQIQFVSATDETAQIDLKKWMGEFLPIISGKGGGKPTFVQGGGEGVISSNQFLQEIIDTMKREVL